MYVFVCTCVCVSKLLPNHCSAISPHFRGGNSPLFMLSLSFLCNAFHSAPKLTKLKTRPKSCNWKHDVCDSLSQFVFWFCFLQCFTSNSHIINITKVNNTDNLISELCSAGKYFLLVFMQMFLRHVPPTKTLLQTEWNRFLLCAVKAWCLMTNTDIINFTEISQKIMMKYENTHVKIYAPPQWRRPPLNPAHFKETDLMAFTRLSNSQIPVWSDGSRSDHLKPTV